MDLSLVIVNYNVKHFLEQCLQSVRKASQKLEVEVFVVDNNSVDGSTVMLSDKFPDVELISNDENLGFSRANNQAIRRASGRYILLLNPDTLIEEDTLDKCVAYMDDHPSAGGLGVKMIDGNGRFLPESKRALPTPAVAFYKIFGLSRIFPGSRIFGQYHLGYLDRDEIHSVDVLTGAFMMLRRQALDETGLLDEEYFMYGEDIDLSYRLKKAGYENIYFPEATIIHYKGESTKKGSLNYVLTFYNAMLIFARKHYSRKIARTYSMVIKIAIYFRAFLSILKRITRSISLPILQAGLIFLGFYLIKPAWEQVRFQGSLHYPPEYLYIVVPAYILVWMISLCLSGAYDRPARPSSIFRGIVSGTLIILVVYALLPESLRFSRALLLMGAVWSMVSGFLLALFYRFIDPGAYDFNIGRGRKAVIVGRHHEAGRVSGLLGQTGARIEIIGNVNPSTGSNRDYIGGIRQLKEIIEINGIDEIIFCAADISSADIIRTMMKLPAGKTDYKIAPVEGLSIIGSNSINAPGDLYLIDFESILKPANKRNKRLFDMLSSLILLVSFPLLFHLVRKPGRAFINLLAVLAGKRSMVGLHGGGDIPLQMSRLRPGLLCPDELVSGTDMGTTTREDLDLAYARNYRLMTDVRILVRGFKNLGQRGPERE